MKTRRALRAAAAGAVAAACLASIQAADAAAPMTEQITCSDASQVTIRGNDSHGHPSWNSTQIVSGGSGHLTPLAFHGVATDTTVDQVMWEFTVEKGGGQANHQQPTITCTARFIDGTVADILDPGEAPPAGTSLTDHATFDLTVVMVRNP